MKRRAQPEKPVAPRRVFLVEDHPITCEGLAAIINHQTDLEVCGLASTALEALAGVQRTHPDLALIDISLGDVSGIELTKSLRPLAPELPILILSTHDERLYADRALQAGARGYVMKGEPTREILEAMRKVLRGEVYLSQAMQNRVLDSYARGKPTTDPEEVRRLSDRELEVFGMLGRGLSTREVSRRLRVSVSTVETHRAHIKDKLRLRNAVELMHRAVAWANEQRA